MILTNKHLYKELNIFKNITISDMFKDSLTNNSNEVAFLAEIFKARISVTYNKDNLYECVIKPFNRGFHFHFSVINNELKNVYFSKIYDFYWEVENNDEELSNISQQIYSFVTEQNKHFEKDIIKEKVENF